MTDVTPNVIHIPGIQARVVVEADYNWRELGKLLADGFDAEQAELLDSLAAALRENVAGGLLQLHFLAEVIREHPDEYNTEAVKWLLSELLIRLENPND